MSFKIGEKVTERDLKPFAERLGTLASGKLFILKFVAFQYGKLSENCKPHIPIIAALKRHKIDYPNASIPFQNPFQRVQEKEKDKEQETEEETEERARATPAAIYDAYPRKIARPEAIKAIEKSLRAPPEGVAADEWPVVLLQRTAAYAEARKDEPVEYTPHPSTWFNQERYNDNPKFWKSNQNGNHRPTHRAAPAVTRNTAELPFDRPSLDATAASGDADGFQNGTGFGPEDDAQGGPGDAP